MAPQKEREPRKARIKNVHFVIRQHRDRVTATARISVLDHPVNRAVGSLRCRGTVRVPSCALLLPSRRNLVAVVDECSSASATPPSFNRHQVLTFVSRTLLD